MFEFSSVVDDDDEELIEFEFVAEKFAVGKSKEFSCKRKLLTRNGNRANPFKRQWENETTVSYDEFNPERCLAVYVIGEFSSLNVPGRFDSSRKFATRLMAKIENRFDFLFYAKKYKMIDRAGPLRFLSIYV